MSAVPIVSHSDPITPYWLSALTPITLTPDLQVSSISVNAGGDIVLASDPAPATSGASIAFQAPTGPTPLLSINLNKQANLSNDYQITALGPSKTTYEAIASGSLVLYGSNTVGAPPIATLQENLSLNTFQIVSPSIQMSNLYVSTINGQPYGGGGGSSTIVSSFNYLFSRVGVFSTLSASTFTDFTGGITASTITSQTLLASTIAFNPSLGGLSPKIDLGMGGFLGGIAGSIGSGIFNTILGGAALATGIAGLMMPRGPYGPGGSSTNLNSNNFELINGTTQLQVSTLGTAQSSILRFVSSIAPNVPGREIFISTIVPAGSVALRSMSDPLNLANPTIQTSSIQSFGQWTLMPFQYVSSGTVVADTISSLTVSSINTVGWDTIQYWNMAPVNQGQFVVVNDSNHYLYIGATLTGYPPPGPNPQYAYYSIKLVNGHYTYQGFVDMVNAVLGQSGGPSQIVFAIDPISHLINIQNVNLNISPLTQVYTIIWNPSTGAPFAGSNFTPAWTSNSVTASSQLFGASLSNVNQSPNPPSPLVFLPTPVPLTSFTGPVPFGPYLQVSTIFSASTITSPAMSTMNINLSTINGQPYIPGGGGGSSTISASISSLTVSSINTVGWDQIQYWNVAPTFDSYSLLVTAGSNDAVFMGVTSLSNPSINSNIAIIIPPANYTSLTAYCQAFRTALLAGPAQFHTLYPSPYTGNGYMSYANLAGGDYVYTIYFNTLQTYLFPGYTSAQMIAVGNLQGAEPQTNVVITTNPNFAVLPNDPGNPVYITYPFSADIQVSTLTVAQNLTTPSINNTSWNTIQYFNQNSSINSNDRTYTVTSSNNIICMTAVDNTPPAFLYRYGFLIPVGTYTTENFLLTVNNAIQTWSLANTPNDAFNNISVSVNSNFQTVFTNITTGIPPPSPTTFYNIDFQPVNFASYSNATSNLMVGSADLFGASNVSYVVYPNSNAITLPYPNYTPTVVPPRPFGADLQLSTLTIAGQGLVTGLPTGSITMYAGNVTPSGYLPCDGTYYSVEQYQNLYNALAQGQIYGLTNDNLYFAVPDLQARFPLGKYTNPNPVNISVTRPNVPGSNGYILLLNTNSPTVITSPASNANLITSDMNVYYATNTYPINKVIWSGPSTTAPYSICYVVSILTLISYDGLTVSGYAQLPANPPFGTDWNLGGESVNAAYNNSLTREMMAPHTHGSYVGKGGTNGAVDTIAVNATGFPNITYGQQPTTDGTTYFNNRAVPNSLPVGQVTPGLGFDVTPYNFSTISGFSAPNNNVTVAPALPPYTIVNYIIKY